MNNRSLHSLEHDQIARVVDQRGRRLLFRGWNRLCLNAAALNAIGEAHSVTATSRPATDSAELKRTTAESSGFVTARKKTSAEGRRREEELRRRRAKITVRETLVCLGRHERSFIETEP